MTNEKLRDFRSFLSATRREYRNWYDGGREEIRELCLFIRRQSTEDRNAILIGLSEELRDHTSDLEPYALPIIEDFGPEVPKIVRSNLFNAYKDGIFNESSNKMDAIHTMMIIGMKEANHFFEDYIRDKMARCSCGEMFNTIVLYLNVDVQAAAPLVINCLIHFYNGEQKNLSYKMETPILFLLSWIKKFNTDIWKSIINELKKEMPDDYKRILENMEFVICRRSGWRRSCMEYKNILASYVS